MSIPSVEPRILPKSCDRPPWILVSILCCLNAWHAGEPLRVFMHLPAHPKGYMSQIEPENDSFTFQPGGGVPSQASLLLSRQCPLQQDTFLCSSWPADI